MAQAKYLDAAMNGNRGVYGGGDELRMDEMFSEIDEEYQRLMGGEYGFFAERYIPIDEVGEFGEDVYLKEEFLEDLQYLKELKNSQDYQIMPENRKEAGIYSIVLATDIEDARKLAEQGIMPVYFTSERGAAICDPLDLIP